MYKPYPITELIKISSIYSLFERRFKRGYTFSGETHDFWECLYVMDGYVCASGDERIYNLQKNDLIFHKPLELHKFFVDNTCGAYLFIFSFHSDSAAMELLKNKAFRLNSEQTEIIQDMLKYMRCYSYSPDAEYPNYLTRLQKDPAFPQMLTTYLYRLFLLLMHNKGLPAESDTTEAIVFRSAVNYMTNCLSRNPSIGEIAKICNISQTGLKQIFQKYSGLGVHKYLLNLKINTAVQYLGNGLSVTEISDLLGFSSQGHFSCVFRNTTGFTPSDYKKKILSDK